MHIFSIGSYIVAITCQKKPRYVTWHWSDHKGWLSDLVCGWTQKLVTWLFSRIIIPSVSIPVLKCHLINSIFCWIILILVGYHTHTASQTMACITSSYIFNTFALLLVHNDIKCLMKTGQAVWPKTIIV